MINDSKIITSNHCDQFRKLLTLLDAGHTLVQFGYDLGLLKIGQNARVDLVELFLESLLLSDVSFEGVF